MYIKQFSEWFRIKQKIEQEERGGEVVRRGEIRWSTIGVNVGREMDGKGENFARPVLIIHTIGDALALVAPLTSKSKNTPGYVRFEWLDHKDCICIHQMRIVSTKRLLMRLAKVSDAKLEMLKKEIKNFYSF